MKEHIAVKIYASMIKDSPFDDVMNNVKSSSDKISFRIAEEIIQSLEEIDRIPDGGDEGLPLMEKDLSMVVESENGMTKEDDFIDFNINQSKYVQDTECSIIKETENGMSKDLELVEDTEGDEFLQADVDSQRMDMDEPDFADTDSKGEAEELRKVRRKRNKEVFNKQGAFSDMVEEETYKNLTPKQEQNMVQKNWKDIKFFPQANIKLLIVAVETAIEEGVSVRKAVDYIADSIKLNIGDKVKLMKIKGE